METIFQFKDRVNDTINNNNNSCDDNSCSDSEYYCDDVYLDLVIDFNGSAESLLFDEFGSVINMANMDQHGDNVWKVTALNGRISLAYEDLMYIPRSIADRFASTTHTLDLSHNNITDLSFLVHFKQLHTLILDKNSNPDEKSLPYLPSLKVLWLNNCELKNITKWIYRTQVCCPNIVYLSLLGNPTIQTTYNGGTILEHNDYRLFVIGVLQSLRYLDDTAVTEQQRKQAGELKNVYALNGSPLKFVDKFGSSYFLSLLSSSPLVNRRTSTARGRPISWPK